MKKSDKVKAMFRGCFIGDALGMPVETWDANRITNTYGRVDKMLVPDGHKWFNGEPAGSYTDDTQLTLAVAEGILLAPGLNMQTQAIHHYLAFKDSVKGWGNATRESVRRIGNGANRSESGQSDGKGNGVAMKISPVGAYSIQNNDTRGEAINFTIELAKMTHKTSVGVSSGLAQMVAIQYCLENTVKTFDPELFVFQICSASAIGESVYEPDADNLTDRFDLLSNNKHKDFTPERTIAEFGGGSCYAYNSLPFTYAFFLNNYKSIDSLYDVVNAGGDTDSNGSMLAALLGALHGPKIFPQHLIEGLVPDQLAKLDRIADDFCQNFVD